MSKALSEIFDMEPPKKYEPPAIVVENTNSDDDIDLARANLKALMSTVSEALKEAMNVAIESESPRAYEVVTGMIAAAGDLSAKLISSHQVQQKMKAEVGAINGPTSLHQTNNIVYTGTPAELIKHLKGNK
jgi:ethanolamine utilization protein EutA (predicted chaperonin)